MKAQVINFTRWVNKRDRALFKIEEMESGCIEAFLLDVSNDLEHAKSDPLATDAEIKGLYLERRDLNAALNKRFVSKLEKYL